MESISMAGDGTRCVDSEAVSAREDRGIDQVATERYFNRMRSVGIKTLKNKLSEYIRLAASGETVLVTDRDRVVAELVPPRQERSPILADALLAEAVREGWVTPPTIHDRLPPPRSPIATTTQLMAELVADREDR
jgi:prevent-host-death family protein